MSMESSEVPENEQSTELNPEWKERMKEGITTLFANIDLFYNTKAPPYTKEQALSFSPQTFSEGMDERRFIDLSEAEQEFIRNTFFTQVGFDPHLVATQHPIEHPPLFYTTYWIEEDGTSNIGLVNIYPTARSEERMFLHEVTFTSSKGVEGKDYLIAPREFRV